MNKTCLFHISGNQYPPLPAKHHTLRIWEELAKSFDEYHVIARNNSNHYSHSIEGKIHLHLLPACGTGMGVFFFLSWALPYFVWRYRPTHLLAQCPVMGGLAGAFCSRIYNIPLFVELHGTYYFYPSRPGIKGKVEFLIYRLLSPITFKVAKRIRSLSYDMEQQLITTYGNWLSKKVINIPVRVDLGVFKSIKNDYGLHKPVKLIMVGALTARKNQGQLIEHLLASNLDIHLTLVGAGPLEEQYRAMANKYSERILITLTGPMSHDQLCECLSNQDIYVHYSLSEGTPRAILEAMAIGLPVICTDSGFMQGILVHKQNAVILSKPCALDLTDALMYLVISEIIRASLGKNGRKLIEEKFESHKVFDLYRQSLLNM